MNNVSVDVDMLADLPVRTLLKLSDKQRSAKAALEKAAATVRALHALFCALDAADVDVGFDANASIGGYPIEVRIAGAGDKLGEVWAYCVALATSRPTGPRRATRRSAHCGNTPSTPVSTCCSRRRCAVAFRSACRWSSSRSTRFSAAICRLSKTSRRGPSRRCCHEAAHAFRR